MSSSVGDIPSTAAPAPPAPTGSPTSSPPPPPAPAARPWHDRLPEVVAAVGAALVVLALTGFLSSSWDLLAEPFKALVLAATAVVLTLAGTWADRSGRATFARLAPILWATATAVLIGAVDVALSAAIPDATRIAIALAGVVGLGHAATHWHRRPDSVLAQLATIGAAVFAAGPIGTALADAYRLPITDLFQPVAGLLNPSLSTDQFLILGFAHLVVAVAWVALGAVLARRPARVARVGGSLLLAYAALEFNVMVAPIGAVVALLIVLGYLVTGILLHERFLIVAGSIGALLSGVKVSWALFSGEVAVTLTVFAVGLVLLGWAYRAAHGRDDDHRPGPAGPRTLAGR